MRNLLCMAGLIVILMTTGCSSSSGDDPTNASTVEQTGDQNANDNMPVLYNEGEIKEKKPLLNDDGTLAAWGWARHPLIIYNKEKLTNDQKKRLKEWDFYNVYNSDYSFEITMADITWMVLITVSLVDYKTGENFSNMRISFNTDLLTPPLNPYEKEVFDRSGVYSAYTYKEGIKMLTFDFAKSVIFGPEITGEINIQDDPADDSLATAAPFDDEHLSFFYTDKVFAKKASGVVRVKGKEYVFDEKDSYAVLDWGRGVWPKEFEWGWAVASGEVGGKVLGFNFGWGEENASRFQASAIVYDGVVHKMGPIKWDYNEDDIMQPWHFKSDDGRFDITMECDYDHSQNINLGFYYMKTIQPRGRMSGTVVLDDGTVLDVKNILGFAEHCFQKW
jgi:hypothetical protein